jgi:hypothetical protein
MRSYIILRRRHRGPDRPQGEPEKNPFRLAFGQGTQARLDGVPLSSCPYAEGTSEYRGWRAGWQDVDENWGADARGPHRKLPQLP